MFSPGASSTQLKTASGSVELKLRVAVVRPVSGTVTSVAAASVRSGAAGVPLMNSNSAGGVSGVPNAPTAKTWNRCSPYGTSEYGCGDVHALKMVESRAHMNVAPVPLNSKLKDVAVVSKSGAGTSGVTETTVVSG